MIFLSKKSAFAVFLAAFAVTGLIIFLVFGGRGKNPGGKTGNFSFKNVAVAEMQTDEPMRKSGIENVFYTVSETGKVKFFEYKNNAFTEIQPTGSKKITVQVSGQNIPLNVTYLQRDGKTEGFGLFLASDNPGVYLYDYFFVKLRNLPASHQIDKGDVLLLMDENKDDFSKDEKTYEQSFYYNMNSGKVSRFMNEATGSTDLEGKKRSDYAVLTDSVLDSAGKSITFFTSRYYAVTDPNLDVDLDIKERGAYHRLTTHAHFMYAKSVKGGTVFLRENKNGSGFSARLIPYYGAKETVIAEFSGDFEKDYIRSGDFLLNKKSGEITSLLTGKTQKADISVLGNVEFFAISEDGKRAVIAGSHRDEADSQALVFCDFSTDSTASAVDYNSGIYSAENPNFAFGNGYIFFNRPAKNGYNASALSWDDVMKMGVAD